MSRSRAGASTCAIILNKSTGRGWFHDWAHSSFNFGHGVYEDCDVLSADSALDDRLEHAGGLLVDCGGYTADGPNKRWRACGEK